MKNPSATLTLKERRKLGVVFGPCFSDLFLWVENKIFLEPKQGNTNKQKIWCNKRGFQLAY